MKSLSAGSVIPSRQLLVVTEPHDHKTLKEGDVVIMVEAPVDMRNYLFRPSDATLHTLEDQHDQWVHLAVHPSNTGE